MCRHGPRPHMSRSAQHGKARWARKARVFLAGAALGLGAALTGAGCNTMQHAANDKLGDPLLGETPQEKKNATTHAQAPAGLGPIPPAGGTTTAALSGQSPALSIGAADGWARKVDGTPAGATTSGTLKAPVVPVSQPKVYPVPKDESGLTTAPALQPTGSWQASGPAPTVVPTPESLDALLDSRGVIGKKKEDVPGGIHLVCAVTNPANPNANQIYETTAVDYATAVQAIVAQIDARR